MLGYQCISLVDLQNYSVKHYCYSYSCYEQFKEPLFLIVDRERYRIMVLKVYQ